MIEESETVGDEAQIEEIGRQLARSQAQLADAEEERDTLLASKEGSKRPWTPSEMLLLVFVGTAWWTITLSLPSSADKWHWVARITVAFIGIFVMGIGMVLNRKLNGGQQLAGRNLPALSGTASTLLVAVGLVVLMAAVLGGFGIDLDSERRLGIGVGGLAVAVMMIGLTRYDTARAAASLPVVALVIGLAVFPGAGDTMGDELRGQIIKWMGILLGANGVAEAAKQVAVAAGGRESPGDTHVEPS